MTEILLVTGAEFIRKVKKLGRRRGVPVVFVVERGKGSHGTLYFGDRLSIIKHRATELKPGLLHAMLKQLGLTLDDLHGE
jgi:mRNA interferase HicA